METIKIKRKLAEEALDQLKAAQQDSYVQSTQNVIDELELALRQPPVSGSGFSAFRSPKLNNKKMNAKKYYEEMRKAGLTEDITSNDEPDYKQPFYQNIFRLMEGFAQKRKITPVTEFEDVVRPVIKYLCENHHPHVTVIVTPTNAELLEGQKSTGQIMDYVVD